MTTEGSSLSRMVSAGLVAVFCLAMLVYLSSWADVREREIIGPSAVKGGPEGQVFVVSHGSLWVLDPQGSQSVSVPFGALGIHGRVSDVLPLRGGEILIAERGRGLVHRCRLAERVCVPFTTDARFAHLEGSVELAANDDQSHIYMAHTTRHAIHLFDSSGNWIAASDASGLYKFPHRPVASASRLYIADTNHHRLVSVDRDPAHFGEEVRSFSTQTFLGSPGRVYPIAHRRLPDGTWWVVIGDWRLSYSDIVVFDDSGKPLRRLVLDRDASPIALEVVGQRVLAPDPVNLRVAAFTLSGESDGEFGDAAFRSEHTRLRMLKSTYRRLRFGSWAALAAVLLTLLAIRLGPLRSAKKRTWMGLLGGAMVALIALSAVGLVKLRAMGALYEDQIVLVIALSAVIVAFPTAMLGILTARNSAPPKSRSRPIGGR